MPKRKFPMEAFQVLRLVCLYLCFSLSSVSGSPEVCTQTWNAIVIVIRLKSMKGQGNWWKPMFRDTTSSSPVGCCDSWMQLWIQHGIQHEYLWIKDLPGPLPQAWWLQALERWAAWKKAVWRSQHAQAFCSNFPCSFHLCICLMLHTEDGIYSHSAVLLSAAWLAHQRL